MATDRMIPLCENSSPVITTATTTKMMESSSTIASSSGASNAAVVVDVHDDDDDCFDDGCSICLEPFTPSDPPSVISLSLFLSLFLRNVDSFMCLCLPSVSC